ncbi:MAG: putative fluoride ion transporter CrcB [Micavibrio sp.]|nr:MAG: putative fluoride ion transporter CrcB [Micavibrio sp.]
MISTIGAIAAGGAIGATLRYGVNVASAHLWGTDFPWATLTVNVLGSFVMGLLIAVFAHLWQPPQEVKLFLVTGFLGSFTTFSAFSLDVSVLWERGALLAAGGYVLASVVLSVAALFAALLIVRSLVS